MTDNPYESPSSLDTKASVKPPGRTTGRPVGVLIVAALHIIGGVLLCAAQPIRSVGIPPVLLMVGVMFLAILTIASGFGMLIGRTWSWWLASFYYVYGIFRSVLALLILMAMAMADQLGGSSRGPEYYVFKHSGRIIVHFLLLLYFFKGNVLEFFGLESLSKAKAIVILVGICVAIGGAMGAIGFLLSNEPVAKWAKPNVGCIRPA